MSLELDASQRLETGTMKRINFGMYVTRQAKQIPIDRNNSKMVLFMFGLLEPVYSHKTRLFSCWVEHCVKQSAMLIFDGRAYV